MILTLDLGTSATKATVWGPNGPLAEGRSPLATSHPGPGRAEQDPEEWWSAVVSACAAARSAGPSAWGEVEAISFAAARETFVLVDADGRPVAPAIVWSDRRAGAEAAELTAAAGGVEALRDHIGVIVDAGAMVAKLRWLAGHAADQLAAARWALAPRDLLVWRMTGVVATDRTLASRTGCYSIEGALTAGAGPAHLLAPVRSPAEVVGTLLSPVADALGLTAGLPVVLGAGDRACEVLGTGSGPSAPMVSWGTTANVSRPRGPASAVPRGAALSAGALGGQLLECGLASAGAAVTWLAGLCGQAPAALYEAAGTSSPGSSGVTATAWLDGARAPWWEPAGRAAFVGLTSAHGPADLARALIEAVAFDVARCLEALGPAPASLCAAGSGGEAGLWLSILSGVTGSVIECRRPELAASAGALLVAAAALDLPIELDLVNPITRRVEPDPDVVAAYRGLRPAADATARAVLGLAGDSSRPVC